MSARPMAIAVALVAIALVLAQELLPATPLYHTWQYALALAIALAAILAYANGARRGEDGPAGRRLAVALAGAAIVDLAGLAAGLLGPDTATVAGTPGTVTPLPALGAAAFFAPADAGTIERGDAGVTLRRRDRAAVELGPGARRPWGESLLYLEPRPAAYLDASDEHGDHLTITQPTAASFLSPVLLFRERQRIGALDVPLDTFATPARKRVFRALYFTPRDLREFRHADPGATRPALIVTAADDAGHPLGITLVPSGGTATLGGIRLRAALGSYPALAIAAAPQPWALGGGLLLFAAGIAWTLAGVRGRAPSRAGAAEAAR